MGCACLAKCIVLPLNSLFMLIGLGFAVFGAMLVFFSDFLINKVFHTVWDHLEKEINNFQINLPKTADNIKEIPFANELGTALLVIGLLVFVVSFFGWCGATCTTCCRWMLIVFSVSILVIMAAEIITGTMFLVTDSALHDNLRTKLKKKISEEFNETSGNAFSVVMIFINDYFRCCGVDGVADFFNRSHVSCQGYTNGCYSELQHTIASNITWAGLGFAGFLFLQFLEVILAVVIFKGNNKVSP